MICEDSRPLLIDDGTSSEYLDLLHYHNYEYNSWCIKAQSIVEKYYLQSHHYFKIVQPLNRARYLMDPKVTFRMPEWYEVDVNGWNELESTRCPSAIEEWNQHLRVLDPSKMNWEDFYVKFNMVFSFGYDFKLGWRPSSKFTDPVIRRHELSDWCYLTETLYNVELDELHALHNAIDKLQMLLASRLRVWHEGDSFKAFTDLSELYSTKLEKSNRFSDIEVLKNNRRYKIAWSQYMLASKCFNISTSRRDVPRNKKVNEKVKYIWFINQSEKFYKVIHPSRKYKWRTKFNSSSNNRGENTSVTQLKEILKFYYILRIFNSPCEDIDNLWRFYMKRSNYGVVLERGSSFPLYAKIVVDTILGDHNERSRQGFTSCHDETGFLVAQPDQFLSQILDAALLTKASIFSHEEMPLYNICKSRIQGEFRNIYQCQSDMRESPELLKGIMSLLKTDSIKYKCELESQVRQRLNSLDQNLPRSLFIPESEFLATLNSTEYEASILQYIYACGKDRKQLKKMISLPIHMYRTYVTDVLEKISSFDYDYRSLEKNDIPKI